MIIRAKFASVCPTCGERIAIGSSVEWSRGSKARHAACVGKAGAVATPAGRGPAPAPRSDGMLDLEDAVSYPVTRGWTGGICEDAPCCGCCGTGAMYFGGE